MSEQALSWIPSPTCTVADVVTHVAAMAGGVLKLHPKIVVENGAMDATKKYRGKINSVIMSYVKRYGN